ncbi:MAG: glycosyltransferase [Candidatus Binatia bacterium]
MRFCMITTFYPPYNFGGDGLFVQDLSAALAARGHEVHVIHCRDAYNALAHRPPTEPYRVVPGVTVHGLASPFGIMSPFATQQIGRPLFKLRAIMDVLATGFDVIHFHNVSLVGGPAVLALGNAVKLYTFHEYWLVCPTHLLFRFNTAPCVTRHCHLCTLSYGRPPQAWRATGLRDASVRHVDAFLSPSRFGMTTHRRFGLDVPMLHLPSFVPDEGVPLAPGPPPAASPAATPYFLYVGRLEHAKGPATLVAHFRQRGPARLLVAGAGSQEAHLRHLADGDPRIELLGRVERADLAALYRDATAVIVPSLNFEMLPLVVLEASRAGTPVVVRNRGALPEMVAESGGGLVYDDDDQLADALATLLRDRERRDTLGRLGRTAYEQQWSTDVHLRRYLAIVADLWAGRQPAGLEPAGRAP